MAQKKEESKVHKKMTMLKTTCWLRVKRLLASTANIVTKTSAIYLLMLECAIIFSATIGSIIFGRRTLAWWFVKMES